MICSNCSNPISYGALSGMVVDLSDIYLCRDCQQEGFFIGSDPYGRIGVCKTEGENEKSID